jgi:ABC-2 type transport system ATP-binding protein
MIIFKDVTKTFQEDFWKKKKFALENLSFSLEENKVTGFLGRNGAGKTTSIKILLDLIKPTSGSVEFSKALGKNLSQVKSQIGYLPERPYFYPNLTGKEFVGYLLSLNDKKLKNYQSRFNDLAQTLKIDHAIDRKIRGYSKGMLQRIGFISTVIHDPRLIIMDEPLSGLDPIGRKELKEAIIREKNAGKTIFFSSHIVPDLEEISDNILLIDQGKKIKDSPLEDFYSEVTTEVEFIVNALPEKYSDKFFQNGDHYRGKFDINLKQEVLKEIVDKNIEVVSVNPIRPKLEEISYGDYL